MSSLPTLLTCFRQPHFTAGIMQQQQDRTVNIGQKLLIISMFDKDEHALKIFSLFKESLEMSWQKEGVLEALRGQVGP